MKQRKRARTVNLVASMIERGLEAFGNRDGSFLDACTVTSIQFATAVNVESSGQKHCTNRHYGTKLLAHLGSLWLMKAPHTN